jgi:hypothetical protein
LAASPKGIYWGFFGSGPVCQKVAEYSGSTDVDVTTGPLTGSTGGAGKVTVSAANDGYLYLENRSGGDLRVDVRFMAD